MLDSRRLAPSPRTPWPALALAAALTATLAGCSLAPTLETPEAPVATEWPALGRVVATPEGLSADAPWNAFVGNGPLRRLIDLALDQNRDLRLAALAVVQAQAQYDIRRADQLPTVNAQAIGNRQPRADGSGSMSSSYAVGLAVAGWELDLFGRVASLKDAALAQYLATQEARNAVQTSLVAGVTSTWLSLQASEQLLALAQRTLATREESLRLVKLRHDLGVATAIELRQAESLIAAARVAVAQQERQRALDRNALALLVGQPLPDDLLASAATGLQALPDVPAGLPSDLLVRRPDIRQAEHQMQAANAQIGAARAAFLPRITLTASAGMASNSLSGLFQDGNWAWTLSPQALLPIFDAGRNRANLAVTEAGRDIAIAQYEKAIQTAFREVADALASRATLQAQLQAQQAQATAEAERLRLVELRYRQGVASHLEVLDAQRSAFAAQQALAQGQLAQQQNRVQLFRALGGGWKTQG